MEQIYNLLTFREALIVSISVFFLDWISGVTAALRSGRHLKSSIMRETISKKAVNYFHFILLGLVFSYTGALDDLAPLVVIIPAVPELLSLWENMRIIRTKIDTKPKDEEDSENGTDSSE
jgi:hypothetical protein